CAVICFAFACFLARRHSTGGELCGAISPPSSAFFKKINRVISERDREVGTLMSDNEETIGVDPWSSWPALGQPSPRAHPTLILKSDHARR
ncbi:hypothetical protein, partial [Caballeronia sp. J97]|uniref:hypothetical protein n=1 Tax=Caballeronia sp. J97 TaxID=2805429 RepID=UPI002AB1BA6F